MEIYYKLPDVLKTNIRYYIFGFKYLVRHGNTRTKGYISSTGKDVGLCITYNNITKLSSETNYNYGKLHGFHREYSNNQLVTEWYFNNSKRHGLQREFIDGKVSWEAIYEDGTIISSKYKNILSNNNKCVIS